jgi:hypothetical protein
MLQAYVSSVSDVLSMLQVFYINVAKVDRDVAHVAMCYTCMFQVYVPNASSVSDVCCKCFIWMLQNYIRMLHIHASVSGVFYTYVGVSFCWLHMFAMTTHVFKFFQVF